MEKEVKSQDKYRNNFYFSIKMSIWDTELQDINLNHFDKNLDMCIEHTLFINPKYEGFVEEINILKIIHLLKDTLENMDSITVNPDSLELYMVLGYSTNWRETPVQIDITSNNSKKIYKEIYDAFDIYFMTEHLKNWRRSAVGQRYLYITWKADVFSTGYADYAEFKNDMETLFRISYSIMNQFCIMKQHINDFSETNIKFYDKNVNLITETDYPVGYNNELSCIKMYNELYGQNMQIDTPRKLQKQPYMLSKNRSRLKQLLFRINRDSKFPIHDDYDLHIDGYIGSKQLFYIFIDMKEKNHEKWNTEDIVQTIQENIVERLTVSDLLMVTEINNNYMELFFIIITDEPEFDKKYFCINKDKHNIQFKHKRFKDKIYISIDFNFVSPEYLSKESYLKTRYEHAIENMKQEDK